MSNPASRSDALGIGLLLLLVVSGAVVACGSSATMPTSATAGPGTLNPTDPLPPAPPPRPRLLVVTHTAGFRHDSIPTAERVLGEIGSETSLYDTEYCRTGDDVRRMLTAQGLAAYRAVFFANTTGNLGIPDLGAFLDWIASGHAFLGAHSASDTYHDEPRYLAMLGGEFGTHGNQTEADVRVDDPSHPAVAHLAPRFRVFDEIYHFTRNNRGSVTMLLSLDRHPDDGLPGAGQPADLPIAWHTRHGSGRVFYTALGHRDDVWTDARFRQHLAGAIRWAIAP
jgi:type 1 glutamine amidotransferase